MRYRYSETAFCLQIKHNIAQQSITINVLNTAKIYTYFKLCSSIKSPYFSSLRLSTDKLTATDMTTYTAHMANIFAELKPEVIFFIMYETR